MISRILEKRILGLLTQFPCIAMLGPRQVGKTTLAKMLMEKMSNETVYIDLERPSAAAKLTDPELFFRTCEEKCVIIDEVQRKPELFPILRSAIDMKRDPGRFILLGSASPHLLMLSSESLAGRIVYTELTPLVIGELAPGEMRNHWIRGGLPEPFLMPDDTMREEWFRSFVQSYLERDLQLLGLKTSADRLYRLWVMLAHCSGQLLNKSTLAKSLEISVPTTTTYLDFFEHAFLIRRLQPYFHNIRKRLVKSPKIYIRDSGITNHLLRIRDYDALLGNPKLGDLWEGYVVEQLISSLGETYEYFFYRTQHGAECDLVICSALKPVALAEIKFTSVPKRTRSLTIACEDIMAEKNFIIVPECVEAYPLDKDITVCTVQHLIEQLRNRG